MNILRNLPFLLVLVVAVGCGIDPDDKVTISGSAIREDKSALASLDLDLQRSNNESCLITTSFQQIKVAGDGTYSYQILGRDTLADNNVARCFRLMLPTQPKGGTTYVDFAINKLTIVKVPVLQQWEGSLSTSASGTGGQNVLFKDLSQSHGLSSLPYTLRAGSGANTLWSKSGVGSPALLSDYVLEDFGSVEAWLETSNQVKSVDTNTYTVTYKSDKVSVPSGSKVPVSRNGLCTYKSSPTGPCPLTDGKLDRVNFVEGTDEIKLTISPRVLKKAVIRGLTTASGATDLSLEGTIDGGATWVKIADLRNAAGTDQYQEADITHTSPVGQVRLRGSLSGGGQLSFASLREISLFD